MFSSKEINQNRLQRNTQYIATRGNSVNRFKSIKEFREQQRKVIDELETRFSLKDNETFSITYITHNTICVNKLTTETDDEVIQRLIKAQKERLKQDEEAQLRKLKAKETKIKNALKVIKDSGDNPKVQEFINQLKNEKE